MFGNSGTEVTEHFSACWDWMFEYPSRQGFEIKMDLVSLVDPPYNGYWEMFWEAKATDFTIFP